MIELWVLLNKLHYSNKYIHNMIRRREISETVINITHYVLSELPQCRHWSCWSTPDMSSFHLLYFPLDKSEQCGRNDQNNRPINIWQEFIHCFQSFIFQRRDAAVFNSPLISSPHHFWPVSLEKKKKTSWKSPQLKR